MAQKQLAVRQKLRQSQSTNPCLLVEKQNGFSDSIRRSRFCLERKGFLGEKLLFLMKIENFYQKQQLLSDRFFSYVQ